MNSVQGLKLLHTYLLEGLVATARERMRVEHLLHFSNPHCISPCGFSVWPAIPAPPPRPPTFDDFSISRSSIARLF